MRTQRTKVITIFNSRLRVCKVETGTALLSKNQNLRSRHHVPFSLSTSMINNLTLLTIQWAGQNDPDPTSRDNCKFDCRDGRLSLTPYPFFSPLRNHHIAFASIDNVASPRHENQPLCSSLPILPLPDPASLSSLHNLTFRSRACPRPPARRCLGSRRRSAFV